MARTASLPILTLLDDVEKCEKDFVEAALRIPENRAVQVVINSGGGSVYASLAMATAIRLRKLQAEAVVLADCSSSALIVFAACQTRRVAPHASFLFHPMRWTSEDQARLSGAESWSTEFRRVTQVSEDWLAENLPLDRRTLRQWIRQERYVEAHELFERGLAEPMDMDEDGVIHILPKSRSRNGRVRQARIRKVG